MSKKPFNKMPPLPPEPAGNVRILAQLEAATKEKVQILLVLLALVKHLGGEITFPSQRVAKEDKLHFRIENGQTTLTYEAAVGQAGAPSSPAAPPPPPKSRIYGPDGKPLG